MSKIEELIERLCPNGVEFKDLQEVFQMRNGYTPSTANPEYWNTGTIPWFRMEDIRENGRVLNDSIQHITKSAIKGGKLFPANSIIIATSATIGEHALITVEHLCNQRFTSLALKSEFKQRLNMQFVFYYCFLLSEWCLKNTTTSSFASVDMNGFRKFQIPVPPLEIQNEIVKTLDLFTELEARKAQYKHYRDKLLTFNKLNGGGYNWLTINELGVLIRGNGLQKKDFMELGVGCIHYGQIYTHYGTFTDKTKSFVSPTLAKKLKKASKNDLILAGVSENVEDVCKAVVWLGEEDICVSGDTFVLKHKQNGKYLAYQLQTRRFIDYKKQHSIGAKVTRLRSDKLKDFKIPIPSIEEQNRIAEILDKFDALVNDISIGLPAEILARRKQYEYYRNRLLTFKNRING